MALAQVPRRGPLVHARLVALVGDAGVGVQLLLLLLLLLLLPAPGLSQEVVLFPIPPPIPHALRPCRGAVLKVGLWSDGNSDVSLCSYLDSIYS